MRSINLKPDILRNKMLGDAPPILTVLYIGLLMLADDNGEIEYRPKKIRAEVFPYQIGLDIEPMLKSLIFLGLIDRYPEKYIDKISLKTITGYKN